MTLVVPVGYALVVHSMVLTGDAEPFASTYGIEVDTAAPTNADEIAENLHDAFWGNIGPRMPTVLTLTQTEVFVGQDPPDGPVVGVFAAPAPGGGASAALFPQNTTWLIHKRTARGGRAGRGRMYLPCVNEGDADYLGILSPTALGLMQGAASGLLNSINAAAGVESMVLLHDSEGAAALSLPDVITSLQCDTRVATQRRRLRR